MAVTGLLKGDHVAEDVLRAVMIGEGWPPDSAGGLNRYVESLHRALPGADVDSRVIVVGPSASHPASVVVVPPGPLPARILGFTARVLARGRRAHVLDVHFALYGLLPVVLAPLRRLGVVVHFHGPWAEESLDAGAGRRSSAIKRTIERFVYRRADRLIVLSEHSRSLLLGYGVDPTRIAKVRPGVDEHRFHPLAADERERLREAAGIHRGTRLVVAVRRLVPRMGLDLLIDAWRVVHAEEPDALLCIIGDGAERTSLQARADRHGLGTSVRFLGKVDERRLSEWYAMADLAVTPSVQLEGFGLVLLEALMSGTPVLASDVGGIREALEGLGEQHLVSPVDQGTWAAALLRALADPAVLVSRDGARRYAEQYSWSSTAAQVRDVYEAAVEVSIRTRFG